MIIVVISNKKS